MNVPNVVLVIDALRGFLEPEGTLYCGDQTRSIIPTIERLLQREKEAGSQIIFICDNHAADDPEFRLFPPHCVKGSSESEVVPELSKYAAVVVEKTRYSAFFQTCLEEMLRELGPERVVVSGVCTSICVLLTVYDLHTRGYPVDVYVDCVADFDPEAHAFALRYISKILGAKLVELD